MKNALAYRALQFFCMVAIDFRQSKQQKQTDTNTTSMGNAWQNLHDRSYGEVGPPSPSESGNNRGLSSSYKTELAALHPFA